MTLITLGRLVRFCRENAGLKQTTLAGKIGYSDGWLSNLETGQLRPRRDQIAELEKALGLPQNTLTAVYDDLQPRHPVEMFDTYEELERRAASIIDYEALAVPGWLQTEDTARALLLAGRPADGPDIIDDLVARRMKRAHALFERDDPPRLWVVLDESVVRRPIGGSEVHAAQLDHLLEAAERPGLSIQLVPLVTGAHAGLVGTFHILSFENKSDIAYSEDPATGHIHELPNLVRRFSETYHALQTSTMTATESFELIREVRREI